MEPVYLGGRRLLVRSCYGPLLMLPTDDLSLTPVLAATGVHELPLTRYFASSIAAGMTVIDVGAHIGYYAVLFGSLVGPSGQVLAYEPHPRAHAFLRDNLALNYMHDRVKPIRKAVTERGSECVSFFASQRFFGNSSTQEHDDHYHSNYPDQIEEIEVEAEPLSHTIARLGKQIDLLKLDVEGSEYRAMLSMQPFDGQEHVREIVFEINAAMMQSDYEMFGALLKEHEKRGRHFSTLTEEGDPIPASLPELLSLGSCPYVRMA